MESQHETMRSEMEGALDEVRSRRRNHMVSLRLRGCTYWARWHYKGQSYERSTGAKIDERKVFPTTLLAAATVRHSSRANISSEK